MDEEEEEDMDEDEMKNLEWLNEHLASTHI